MRPPSLCKVVRFTFLACLILATTLLFYYAYLASPIQTAELTTQPKLLNSISTLNIQAAGKVDQGVVPVTISGTITDPSVSRLVLITGPPGSAAQRAQATCCAISDGVFAGTGQLGTAGSPLTGMPTVEFQLISSGRGAIAADGSIAVNIQSYPGGSSLALNIVAGLSLVATLASLADLSLRPKRNRQTSTQGNSQISAQGGMGHAENA